MVDVFVGIIRKKLYLIIFALFLSTSLIAGWSVVQFVIEQPLLEETDNILERVAREDLELLRQINAIRFDVIQVQQYLTDVSATRGFGGYDDGFEKAARHAKYFEDHISNAIRLAQGMQSSELVTALKSISADFPPYYDLGRKMAELYVLEGVESGNKLMGDFDARADAFSNSIQLLHDSIEETSRRDLLEMEESVDALKDNNKTKIMLSIFPALLSIIAATFGVIAVRRICHVLVSKDD
ncbi:MAG: hypothetical protein HQ504_06135 [Rhodospirillaceae bacterium]|nr:hypothetical protein [Rhodospirillaceae bacterium]